MGRMASGIARERVRTTTATAELLKMAALLHIMRRAALVYRLLF